MKVKSILFGITAVVLIIGSIGYLGKAWDFTVLREYTQARDTRATSQLHNTEGASALGTVQLVTLDTVQHSDGQYQSTVLLTNGLDTRQDIQTASVDTMAAGPPCDVIDCANTGMPFTVSGSAPPGQAVTINPVGNIATTTPVFEWNEQTGATHYRLLVWNLDTASAAHNTLHDSTTFTCAAGICQMTPPGLTLSTNRYRWWLKATNSAGEGPWSSLKNFNITNGTTPGQVVTISPSGNIMTTTPTFEWNEQAGATHYRLLVWNLDTASAAHNTLHDSTAFTCAAGICQMTPPGLTLSTNRYRWWLKATNSAGEGPWSSLKNFNITNGTTPGQVVTISPIGNIATTTPVFEWNEQTGATHYRLLVWDLDTASSAHNILHDSTAFTCSAGICQMMPSGLTLSSNSYRWWLKATNSAGDGPWSSFKNFVITSIAAAGVDSSIESQDEVIFQIFIPYVNGKQSNDLPRLPSELSVEPLTPDEIFFGPRTPDEIFFGPLTPDELE